MTNKNLNFAKLLKKYYGKQVINDVTYYQPQYGFDMGQNNDSTWNNEGDAFKHTYMQTQLALLGGKNFAKLLGDGHEQDGINRGQPSGEENMDLWNNSQGRQIAKEIIREYGALQNPFSQRTKDIIAQKVMEKMRNGDLITKPEDARVYQGKAENIINEIKKRWDGIVTGQAAPVEPFTRQQIGQMSPEGFAQNESSIMEQLRNGVINDDYTPTDNASESIVPYTREDIAGMTTKEFSKNEKDIMAQLKTQGIPSQKDLPSGKKSEYSKGKSESSKGSSNKGSKSSSDGKWVTINGNHVLIKD